MAASEIGGAERSWARAASPFGIGPGFGPARLPLGGYQRLEAAGLLFDQVLEAAKRRSCSRCA